LLRLVLMLPLLTACGLDNGSSNQPVDTTQQNAAESSNYEPPKSSIKRGGLLSKAQSPKKPTQPAEQQATTDPYLARYDKARLDKAATMHSWSKLSIGSHGVEAYLTTYWARGLTHIRAAVLGSRENLSRFQRDYETLIVHLQDDNCNSLRIANIPVKMMKQETSAKGGIPTLSYEGQLECSLEEYEHVAQWFLEWN